MYMYHDNIDYHEKCFHDMSWCTFCNPSVGMAYEVNLPLQFSQKMVGQQG